MNKKNIRPFHITKVLLFSIIAVAVTLLGFALHGSVNALDHSKGGPPAVIITHPQSLPSTTKPLTLLEALKISKSYALTIKSDAVLVNLVSSDIGDSTPKNAGLDGTRRTWIAYFNLESNQSGLRIQVTDGAVVEADKTPYPMDLPAILHPPLLDSPAALQVALENRVDFSPSTDPRGQGYHFNLQADEKGYPLISIIGTSQQTAAMVNVDATNGGFLSAKRYEIAPKGAILYSSDAGMTWHESDLTKHLVSAIVEDPSQKDVVFASTIENGCVVIYTSKNAGINWSILSQLPAEAGKWAYSLAVFPGANGEQDLLVGTPNGLWGSNNFGSTWKTIDSKPAGFPQWMSLIKSQGSSLLVLSLTGGTTPGLYTSKDLVTWTKLADGVYRLSRSFDSQSVIATDENNFSPALYFDGNKTAKIPVPSRTLRLAGDFSNQNNMLAQTNEAIYSGDGTNWDSQITVNNFASIAVSPDYLADGLVIAGGFHTGIYRSSDHGHTWQEITHQQPDILSDGTGEIPYVVFLSDQNVILVNGGEFTWLDY